MPRYGRFLSLVALTAAATLTVTGTAHASAEEPVLDSVFTITVWETGSSTAQRGEATLDCAGFTGTHPHPREACEAYFEAGSVEALEGPGHTCPQVWEPVAARVTGAEGWSSDGVYSNYCFLIADKGVFFDIL